jgi:hypothetical protein
MKVEGIQKGLTFINENARVQFPRVDNTTLNAQTIAFASGNQFSPAAGQDLSSPLVDIITRITNKWETAIRQQAIMAGCFFAIYAVVALVGMTRVLSALKQTGKNRGEGGKALRLPAQGIAWARYKFRTDRDNPFEDPRFEHEPGPTPSVRVKQ